MKTPEHADVTDLVAIGRIAKTHGRHGEVVVNPLTDFPERFLELPRVFVVDRIGGSKCFPVGSARFHKGRPLLKLAGVENIADAKMLADHDVSIPASEVKKLPAGTFYHFEIIGLSMRDAERGDLGTVVDIVTTGGTDVLVVEGFDGTEHLVPFCSEYCRGIDPGAGFVDVRLYHRRGYSWTVSGRRPDGQTPKAS